mgnify:CR=1 FL=1
MSAKTKLIIISSTKTFSSCKSNGQLLDLSWYQVDLRAVLDICQYSTWLNELLSSKFSSN